MKKPPSSNWVSYYLYYETDPDALLTTQVQPLIEELAKKQLISRFFFIRYADGRGSHIRLRLLPATASARPAIMRRCKKAFPDAVFSAYIPETERYGGPAGLPVAEQLFHASSTAVLQLITQDKAWSYSRALASALQLHIGMLQAFGLAQTEAAALCKHIAETKSRHTTEPLEQGFSAQRETLAPRLTALWAACQNRVQFKDRWFTEWCQAMAPIGTELQRLQKLRRLELVDSPAHPDRLWCLYESYMHMTSNRLGIVRRDEAFISYLLYRSLS